MEFDRQAMKDFFLDDQRGYFKSYSTVAQDPDHCSDMFRFYSPDIAVTTYFPIVMVVNREQFLKISCAHPHIQETLIPQHCAIDENQGLFAVLLKATFEIKSSGEVVEQEFTAHYKLTKDEEDELKIEKLWIFAEWVAPGRTNIVDLYEDAFRAALS
ncbi:MAG: hypothetical protein M5U22_07440 [Thermoleophilia bacterium]|nr:hypothetical protein [Thermoleophilia bacterium]